MTKFIKFLQIVFLALFLAIIIYDFFFQGISIFTQKYVLLSGFFLILLESSLFVIVKLTEDD
jgi:hypothetical protein